MSSPVSPGASRATIALLLLSSLLMLVLFQWRFQLYRASTYRAAAAQWVLTTAWMEERYHRQHKVYAACGEKNPPCWDVLGWMNRPPHLEGYGLSVTATQDTYEVQASGAAGRWVLQRGQPIRWEGYPVPVPWPRISLQRP